MKRLERFSGVAVISVGLLLLQLPAQGEVLLNTLDQDLWDSDTASSSAWIAQSFNSGGFTELSKVTLNLYNAGSDGGVFDLDLYSSSGTGGPPGSFVERLGSSLSVPTTTDSENRFYVPVSVVLSSAPLDYYIVLKPKSGSSVSWGYMGKDPTGEYPASYSFGGQEGNWTAFDEDPELYPHRMLIEAVPEPSTWAGIIFLGVLGIGQLGRKLFHFARN